MMHWIGYSVTAAIVFVWVWLRLRRPRYRETGACCWCEARAGENHHRGCPAEPR
jgi:hypothetical protein